MIDIVSISLGVFNKMVGGSLVGLYEKKIEDDTLSIGGISRGV